MKLLPVFFLLIFLALPLISADLTSFSNTDALGNSNITTTNYEKDTFIIKYFSDNETQKESPEIMWKEKADAFWIRYEDDNLYDSKAKDPNTLKVPLSEFHFEVNQFESPVTCTGNQFFTSCSQDSLDFTPFEKKNEIGKKFISGIYPDGWDGWWTCIKENNFIYVNEVVGCMEIPTAFRISYTESNITNTDPLIITTITSSDNIPYRNETEGSVHGVSLVYNNTAQSGYNKTIGDLRSWVYWGNSTSWNVTAEFTNSTDSSDSLYDICDADANCVSYWNLDGNYQDSKGTNHGTPTGTNNATGISSGAMRFDGVDDFINVSSGASLAPLDKDWSINVWFKTTSAASEKVFTMANKASGATEWIDLNVNTDNANKLTFRVDDGSDPITDLVSNSDVNDGAWHHTIITRVSSTNTWSMYVDGLVQMSDTNADSSVDSAPIASIGSSRNAGIFFNGSIDEVLIYNDSLTASEVTSLYEAGLSQHANTNLTLETRNASTYNISDPSLVSLWSFNDDNSSTALDETKNHNGTLFGGLNPASEDNGTVGKGYGFDASSTYIEVPDSASLDITDTITISAWIYPKDLTTQYFAIVDKYYDGVKLAYFMGTNFNQLRMLFANDTAHDINTEVGTLVINKWQHVAVVSEGAGNSVYGYIDGVQFSAGTKTGTMGVNTDDVDIGRSAFGDAQYFDGAIDEVRIYNRSLSATEVKNLYEMGSYHIEDWSDWSNAGSLVDNVANNNSGNGNFFQFRINFNSNESSASPYVFNITVGPTSNPTGGAPVDTTLPEINFTDPTPADGNLSFSTSIYVNISSSDDSAEHMVVFDFNDTLAAWYRFEPDNGTYFNDSSNHNKNATCDSLGNHCPSLLTDGRFGHALNFSNGNRSVDLPGGIIKQDIKDNGFTIIMWAYMLDNESDNQLYAREDNSISLFIEADMDIRFFAKNGTGVQYSNVGDKQMEKNKWVHLAFILNETSSLQVFKDGVMVSEQTDTRFGDTLSEPDTAIGWIGRGAFPAIEQTNFSGYLDEPQFYNRVLTSREMNATINATEFQYFNNFTGLNGGNYSLVGYAQDEAGNVNSTSRDVYLFVDTIAPYVNFSFLVFPTEETYLPTAVINITTYVRYAANDTLAGEDVTCRLTSYYPNTTLFFADEFMTFREQGRWTYTHAASSLLGEYSSIAACYDGQDSEQAFTFTVANPSTSSSTTSILDLCLYKKLGYYNERLIFVRGSNC